VSNPNYTPIDQISPYLRKCFNYRRPFLSPTAGLAKQLSQSIVKTCSKIRGAKVPSVRTDAFSLPARNSISKIRGNFVSFVNLENKPHSSANECVSVWF
jgi:hypothetical protein